MTPDELTDAFHRNSGESSTRDGCKPATEDYRGSSGDPVVEMTVISNSNGMLSFCEIETDGFDLTDTD